MRANFKIMILLAVVCGGGAVWAGGRWLDNASAARLREIEAAQPSVTFGTLMVAAEPLRFGAPLSRQSVREIPWPQGDLPPGAFATADDLFKDGDRTVLYPLEEGEPLFASKLTGPGERAALSRLISDGNRAVTLRVNDVAGVGGLALPGDRVDVVLTTADVAEVILQDVRILSIDQMADEKSAEPMVAHTATVEVSPEAAQKLVLAQSVGSLSLVLRRAGEVRAAAFRPISIADLTTARETENAKAELPPTPPATDATVWVRRATELTQYSVPVRDGGPSRRVTPPDAPAAPAEPAADVPPSSSAPIAAGEPQ
ncbi:Flp pilus assembly protein CpaB [Pleomorphomonas diazotrophica]|uniref:Flp pilus assembly protein CpaB n=1 Tax=Pleomorphomonas diazotrophica TaxID=1166257 RepID=A0A1I4TGK6_9HYPH|nr:Flp pilus assembly protein CpaB [Pleomorphomonas diazotrophica]PKR87239.1 Flp pilus assembly protein CpaB [Pleomorphomonas diazotrophica]SFM75791.1 pilus assembly protein CpaB [Pleomorphomonas diazotrophica]